MPAPTCSRCSSRAFATGAPAWSPTSRSVSIPRMSRSAPMGSRSTSPTPAKAPSPSLMPSPSPSSTSRFRHPQPRQRADDSRRPSELHHRRPGRRQRKLHDLRRRSLQRQRLLVPFRRGRQGDQRLLASDYYIRLRQGIRPNRCEAARA